jgi:hypothetical protein
LPRRDLARRGAADHRRRRHGVADVDLDDLLERCAGHGIAGRIGDVADFARLHQVLLLRHDESGTPMEVSLSWLPFERAALQRAELLDVEGVTVPVAAVRDLIVYKIVAWRARDQTDVERLLRTHAAALDLAALRAVVAEFADLLEAPERLRAFDRLVEQVRKSE